MSGAEWCFGNAAEDGAHHRGWIVGHFMAPDDLRHSEQVEVKWGIHPKGEERVSWQDDEQRTSIVVLVAGRFRVNLSVTSHLLQQQGDYAMWGPGIGHSWKAEEESIVITFRWPSIPSNTTPVD